MGFGKNIKNHLVASLGEFFGTFLFLFFAFGGTQIANLATQESSTTGPNLAQLTYISLVFGFSLAINVWVFFRISGGLFNPAVTLALCLVGVVPPVRSVFIVISQLVGAIAAAGAVKGLLPGSEVLFAVQLTNGTSVAQGLFLEMFFTAELVFTILMLAAEKTKATFVAPVGIGLALFVAELMGVYYTGGSLNPARAFAPSVVDRTFPTSHWIYWVGPILGALLAAGLYKLLKVLKYEEVNGDQDKTGDEEHNEEMEEGDDSRRSRGHRRSSQRSPRHSREPQNQHAGNRRHSQSAPRPPPKASPIRRTVEPSPARYSNGAPYVQDTNAQTRRSTGYPSVASDATY